ncbi:dedicator of cytokinesis protein 1 isoform X1, partial [Tachysurus ichikawai]
KLFSEFILKVPPGRLVKQKLYCMIDIVHSDLFTQHGMQTLHCPSDLKRAVECMW